MQTIKTSIVVTFMLVVLYGAYVALNAPQPVMPDELAGLTEVEALDIDMGMDIPPLAPPPASSTAPDPEPPLMVNRGTSKPSSAMASLTDLPHGQSHSLTDLEDDPELNRLPKPDPKVGGTLVAPDISYPKTTSAGLTLPDPKSLGLNGNNTGLSMPEFNGPDLSKNGSTSGNPLDLPPKPQGTGEEKGITNAFETANRQVSEGRLREALFTLSIFYGSPDLTTEQQKQLLDMLDPLAGEVIYSQGHFLEAAHKTQRGDSLESIASEYQIPEQLLANINQISNPDVLLPGTELKVLRGPFRAEVNLARSEITLFLGDLYAGRFPITAGKQPAPKEGTYTILDKQRGRDHQLADGRAVPVGSPENPFGDVWFDLGQQLAIHGAPANGANADFGCIRLSPVDARDLFGILAKGSPVTIRR